MDDYFALSEEELQKIPDVGPVAAKCIYDYFHDESKLAEINELKALGVNMDDG